MWIGLFLLAVSLAVILFSCELFTNSIEWLGNKLNVGDGVVGSIFSAVGTCLPETMIPIIAILFSTHTSSSVDVGIGAIVGAPFMLGTLAFFVSGISVVLLRKKRKKGLAMDVNCSILKRDLGFFIIVYSIGIASSYIQISLIKHLAAIFLVACYIYYIIITVKSDQAGHSNLEPLHIIRFLDLEPNMPFILFQVCLSLFGIIFGAHLFVSNLEAVSHNFGIAPLVLSLIITPVATELPEKFNSVIWISKNKDTLALGNISGAMVFQSCIPVTIGILSTPWILDPKALLSALLSVLSASVTYMYIKINGKLSPFPLLTGGLFYATFIVFLIARGFQ